MHDKSTSTLVSDALDVISVTDPRLYARMTKADWTITTDGASILHYFKPSWRNEIRDVMDGWSGVQAYGLTISDRDRNTPTDHPASWINTRGCTDRAYALGVTPEHFTAMILAHEFAHIHDPAGHTEAHAYRAGSKFAAKIPAPDGPTIKSYSDYIARDNA